ncbi:ClpXP protease specificity-enhancing factor [Utexia brackfieldae]|uniref:ClpXP protease specificity-enhancing factor n=1 Tax=Utexia brackfieldae TaxID=3074108 RepID=UPI00370D6B44
MEFSEEKLLPRRPYLFRAFYDWILDNELTPLVVVDATKEGVDVPAEYIADDKIVLNIAPHSVGQYLMNNDGITFSARFNGVLRQINVPMAAIEAIYARENSAGLGFAPEPQYETQSNTPSAASAESLPAEKKKTEKTAGPTFRVVK